MKKEKRSLTYKVGFLLSEVEHQIFKFVIAFEKMVRAKILKTYKKGESEWKRLKSQR